MKELEQSKKPYSDPYFPYQIEVLVKRFSKTLLCKVGATEQALMLKCLDPDKVWEGSKELHYIGRQEDLYGSHHYKDRIAVQLTKEDRQQAEMEYIWKN